MCQWVSKAWLTSSPTLLKPLQNTEIEAWRAPQLKRWLEGLFSKRRPVGLPFDGLAVQTADAENVCPLSYRCFPF